MNDFVEGYIMVKEAEVGLSNQLIRQYYYQRKLHRCLLREKAAVYGLNRD